MEKRLFKNFGVRERYGPVPGHRVSIIAETANNEETIARLKTLFTTAFERRYINLKSCHSPTLGPLQEKSFDLHLSFLYKKFP